MQHVPRADGTDILTPAFWLERLQRPHAVLLDQARIERMNATLLRTDPSMHDLAGFADTLEGAQVRAWMAAYDGVLKRDLHDVHGRPISAARKQALREAAAVERVPERQPTRYGLVVRRAPMRAVPDRVRAFSTPGDTDIDRFQESAEFPGTPVVIAHASRDSQWLFVVSPRYAAWMPADAVAEGSRQAVLGHAQASPYRIVLDATPRTVFTPEEPRVSELQLDMGVRAPLVPMQASGPVNGQFPQAHWVLRLPVRGADGRLAFSQALLPTTVATAAQPLPLTRANLVTQAFKFLGERYGWGHSHNGRDCSGFVAEVYRSMGVTMPRNTGDQARSPAFEHTLFDADSTPAERDAAIAALDVGDLIYIPGHVMMMLGRIDGAPYVIHDTNGGTLRTASGELQRMGYNGVVVTPLEPMMFNADERYIDRMTSIVRIRPAAAPTAS